VPPAIRKAARDLSTASAASAADTVQRLVTGEIPGSMVCPAQNKSAPPPDAIDWNHPGFGAAKTLTIMVWAPPHNVCRRPEIDCIGRSAHRER